MVKSKEQVVEIIRAYQLVLDELFDGVQIRLYGSYLKGTANEFSDIDIAVVSSDFYGISHDVAIKLLARLRLKIDRSLEPMPFTPDDLSFPVVGSLSYDVAAYNELIS